MDNILPEVGQRHVSLLFDELVVVVTFLVLVVGLVYFFLATVVLVDYKRNY